MLSWIELQEACNDVSHNNERDQCYLTTLGSFGVDYGSEEKSVNAAWNIDSVTLPKDEWTETVVEHLSARCAFAPT